MEELPPKFEVSINNSSIALCKTELTVCHISLVIHIEKDKDCGINNSRSPSTPSLQHRPSPSQLALSRLRNLALYGDEFESSTLWMVILPRAGFCFSS